MKSFNNYYQFIEWSLMKMTESKSAKAYCRHCKQKTNHISVKEPYKKKSNFEDDIHWYEYYYVAKCMGCDTIAFIKEYSDEEMWEKDPFTGEQKYSVEITIYPEQPKIDESIMGTANLQLSPKEFEKIPQDILSLYTQVIHIYNLKYYLLCAFGLRTLIEAVCKEVGVNSGILREEDKLFRYKQDGCTEIRSQSLEGKIYGLYEGDYILWKHALILQKVRDVGNSAAHEIKPPSMTTVKESIKIIEKVLEDIYDLDKYQRIFT